jgi:vacuolar-type H+-ATPase subunit E/Vma4
VQRAGLQAGQLPNPGLSAPLQDLQGTLVDLERLQAEQVQQLGLRLAKQLEQVRRSQFERRSRVIRRVFDEYRQWVEDTLSTEPEPYLQVLAAVCG